MTPPETATAPIEHADRGLRRPPLAPRADRARCRRSASTSKIFRASLVERLTYRADFLLGTLLRFLPMLTTILLWQAIYAGAAGRDLEPGAQAASRFQYDEMIAYLLLVNISRMFSSMPGLAGGIARDIREGTIKKYLLQPLDMIGYLVSYRVAHKVTYIISSALPYALLFFLCRGYFDGHVPTEPDVWLGFAASLLMAFVVGFFFEASVGMVGFWFLEVTSLLYIVMTRELLRLRPHVPARLAAPALVDDPEIAAVPVHGLLPGGGLPGQGAGLALALGPAAAIRSGPRSSSSWPAGSTAAACGATAPSEDDRSMTAATRYVRLVGSLGALRPGPRAGVPRQLPGRRSRSRCSGWGSCWRSTGPSSRRTSAIADWSEPQYLFFVGCFFALNGLIETLFLENCNEFAELVRTGDLDFLLLKPIDEQFLITCRKIDWSTAPNVLMGAGVMVLVADADALGVRAGSGRGVLHRVRLRRR